MRQPITTSFEHAVITLVEKGVFVLMTKEDGGRLYHIPLAILGDILTLKKYFYLAFAQATLTVGAERSVEDQATQFENLWMSQYQDYDYHLEACGY